MTVRLTVRRPAWRGHLAQYAASIDGLVPVVKGNGYGFGRAQLLPVAAELAAQICVGTIHELVGFPDGAQPVVLTPIVASPQSGDQLAARLGLPASMPTTTILTVGHDQHIQAISSWNTSTGWAGAVIIKLRSSMNRYGVSAQQFAPFRLAVIDQGLSIAGYAIHLPLAGSDDQRRSEIEQWIRLVPDDAPIWVSHLAPTSFADLQTAYPARQFLLRSGTALWHGDKSMLRLSADVLDTRPVAADDHAGYRRSVVERDGTLVLIGAGSAHGIVPLSDGSSPFHFARRRLELVEPPHMHTSMALVSGGAIPSVGDRIDVQRPLTMTQVDEVEWMT